ncbi:MAG: ATP-binding protein [Deltaproteobacteria bacterium]|nr:MAG: ATP-binding protein [Deltaproteobacteria bacterium]
MQKAKVESQAVAKLLPYWKMVGDHLIHVDGCVTGGLELQGLSLECLSPELLERLNSQIKLFLHALPTDADIQFIYQVRPFSPLLNQFRKETEEGPEGFQFIWKEKSDYYESQSNIWHTRLYLFLTLKKEEKKNKKSFFKALRQSFQNTRVVHASKVNVQWEESRLRQIHQAMSSLKTALSYLEIPTKELTQRQVIHLLYESMNPNRSETIPLDQYAESSSWPVTRTLREEISFSNLQANPREMILDDKIHRVMTLKDIPQMQYPGIVNRLLSIREFPFNISVGIKQADPQKTLAVLKRSETMQSNLQKGRGRNYEAEQNQNVISDVIQSLVRGETKVFQLSFSIHYWGRNRQELQNVEARLRQEIHQMGEAKELREEFSYPEIFVATLPGVAHENYRVLNTITPQTLSLLPIYQNSRGSARPVALFKNRTDELVGVDPFNPKLSAFNAIIFGPTGRGKSFLAQYLLLQYLRINPHVFIVDIGGSYRRFTSLVGGEYIELKQDQNISLNPFLPRSGVPEPELIGFLAGIVERMVKNEGESHLDKVAQHLIRECIQSLYAQSKHPLNLEGLRFLMIEKSKSTLDSDDETILKTLSKRLALWTEGEGRNLFIGERSISLSSPVITIDLAGLSSNKELQGITIQILTGLIWNQVKNIPGPKLILFDEVWQHLKDPTASRLIDQLYRTARKHYASVVSISQQLEDFLSEEVKTSIVANSATRFILRTDRELTQLKNVFQLNDAELQLIQGLSMRRGYFSEVFGMIGDDHMVLRIEPSSSEYWLCTTHPEDLLVEQKYKDKNPDATLQERIQALVKDYPKGAA